jgi:hypothetical protein
MIGFFAKLNCSISVFILIHHFYTGFFHIFWEGNFQIYQLYFWPCAIYYEECVRRWIGLEKLELVNEGPLYLTWRLMFELKWSCFRKVYVIVWIIFLSLMTWWQHLQDFMHGNCTDHVIGYCLHLWGRSLSHLYRCSMLHIHPCCQHCVTHELYSC